MDNYTNGACTTVTLTDFLPCRLLGNKHTGISRRPGFGETVFTDLPALAGTHHGVLVVTAQQVMSLGTVGIKQHVLSLEVRATFGCVAIDNMHMIGDDVLGRSQRLN